MKTARGEGWRARGGQHEPKGLQGEGGRDMRNAPSLPPLAVEQPGFPNTNIPGSLTKPSCCHGLKPRASLSSVCAARSWGAAFLCSPPASLPAPLPPFLPPALPTHGQLWPFLPVCVFQGLHFFPQFIVFCGVCLNPVGIKPTAT